MSASRSHQVPPPHRWRLCVLVTEALCGGRPWEWVVRSVVAPAEGVRGADCVQLREKGLDPRDLLERAARLVESCHAHGVAAVVNDDVDIAMRSGADGVHLGQQDMPIDRARRMAGDRLWIGSSTTNLDQAERAVHGGADYCGVGPMFPTATKPGRPAATPAYLHSFRKAYPDMPHLAIGGITQGNLRQVIGAGATGVAISRDICGADDPASRTLAIKSLLDNILRQ